MFDVEKLKNRFENICVEEAFSTFNCKSMKHEVHMFSLSDLRISYLSCRGLAGSLNRKMLVVSSMDRDIPFFVMQYSAFFFKCLLQVDILNIDNDHQNEWAFFSLENIVKCKNLKHKNLPMEWYYHLRLPGSFNVSGNKKGIEMTAREVFERFLELSKMNFEPRENPTRLKHLDQFIQDIFNHGCFGYDALRVCLGQKSVDRLFCMLFLGVDVI